MNTYIHIEQRLTALHKMYARPLGEGYLDALRGCVRLSAQLGFVDTGMPVTWRLVELARKDGSQSLDMVAESYSYLTQFAHLCRRENRFRRALDLDSAARSWFTDHRGAYDQHCVASVSGVWTDLAGLDDLGGAIAVLGRELRDPTSMHRSSASLAPLAPYSPRAASGWPMAFRIATGQRFSPRPRTSTEFIPESRMGGPIFGGGRSAPLLGIAREHRRPVGRHVANSERDLAV